MKRAVLIPAHIVRMMFYLALVAIPALQFGCGPKLAGVLKKYEGYFRDKRAEFREIARSLPPKGSLRAEKPCADLAPPLLFDEPGNRFNTEVLMFEELEDPDSSPGFSLNFGGGLRRAILWTGPKSPLSSSADGAGIEKQLKAALGYRYLVVNRVAELVEPVAVDERRYSPGRARIEAFVVDLPSKAVLCSFVFEAASAEHVRFTYKSGESKQEQLAKWAHSTLWQDARDKMVANLKRISNGEIQTH
jgi:hypothetical protein